MRKHVFLFNIIFLLYVNTISSQWVTNGDAYSLGGDCFRITEAAMGQRGSVFSDATISLADPFIIETELYFGGNNNGADGIVFVLTTSNTALGVSGQGIGFQGITPSFGVEFDTYQNSGLGDPTDDHIGIVHSGSNNHNTLGFGPPVVLSNIEDGNYHCFVFSWIPEETNLIINIDGDEVFNWIGNINSYTGTDDVYYGFVGSTGGAFNVQEACMNLTELVPMEDVTICENESTILQADPNGMSYTWDNSDGSLSSTSDADPTATPTETTLYSVTITYDCDLEIVDDVLVTVIPSEEIIIDEIGDLCVYDDVVILNATPIGGSWTGDINFTGSFDPSVLGEGTFKAIYTYINPSTLCSTSACLDFKIFEAPTPYFTDFGPFCNIDQLGIFGAEPIGGIYFIDGNELDDETFNPSLYDPDTYTITYTVENDEQCIGSISETFYILDTPELQFQPIDPVCLKDTIIELNITPTTGVWSGAALSNGTINVMDLGVGIHEIIYTVSDVPQCIVEERFEIEIIEDIQVTLAGSYFLCSNSTSSIFFQFQGPSAATIELLLDGDVIDTIALSPPFEFTVSQAGTYQFGDIFTDSECPISIQGEAQVTNVESPMFENIEIICDENEQFYQVYFTINEGDLTNLIFGGTPVSKIANGVFESDPIANGDSYSITVSDNNNCGVDLIEGTFSCSCESLFPVSLIPNPSFEEQLCCPQNKAELDCAVDWIQASPATTDYLHQCGLTSHPDLNYTAPQPIPDGSGYIGFRDGENGFFFQNFKEYAGTCLTGNLKAGVEYTLDFQLGFPGNAPTFTIDITLFATTDCNNLPFGNNSGVGCPTNTNGWTSIANSVVSGNDEWINISFTFTPDQNYEAIVLGPGCGVNPNFFNQPYFYLDNLILAETEEFGIPIITIEGNICEGAITLESSDVLSGSFQWYKDGVLLQDETNLTLTILNDGNAEGLYNIIVTTDQNCFLGQTYEVIVPSYEGQDYKNVCEGSSFDFYGQIITEAGEYQTILSSQDGCDSTVYLTVELLNQSTNTIDTTVCRNTPITINNETYFEEGLYTQMLLNEVNCDSLLSINLTWLEPTNSDVFAEICPSSSIEFNNEVFENEGTFEQIFVNENGCDSTLFIHIGILENTSQILFDTICLGGSTILNGEEYSMNGSYEQNLINNDGCDSLLVYNLHVNNPSDSNIILTICEGTSIDLNMDTFDSEGFYEQYFSNSVFCDSTLFIEVRLLNNTEGDLTIQKCSKDTVMINNVLYPQSGTYSQQLSSASNCDSTLFIEIIDFPTQQNMLVAYSCNPIDTGIIQQIYSDENGCDSIVTIQTFLESPSACLLDAQITSFILNCNQVSDTVWIDITNGQGPFNYVLQDLDTGLDLSGVLEMNNQRFYIPDISIGNFQLTIYSLAGLQFTGFFMITIAQAPVLESVLLSDFNGFNVTCNEQSNGFAEIKTIAGGTEPYFIEWSTGENTMRIENLPIGDYNVTVTDANQCSDEYSFEIISPNPLIASTLFTNPACYSENNGWATIMVSGGIEDYTYFLNNIEQDSNAFDNLSQGVYEIEVLDANGCYITNTFTLEEPVQLALDLGSDMSINSGESIQIEGITNIPFSEIDSIFWTNIDSMDCPNCLDQEIITFEDIMIGLQIISQNGCVAYDEIFISVMKEKNIFVPNVFSTTANTINNGFTISGSSTLEKITYLQIFDRWGNFIWSGNELQPGVISEGWNGYYNGAPATQGVYVFIAEVRFLDGSTQKVAGDVTLVR